MLKNLGKTLTSTKLQVWHMLLASVFTGLLPILYGEWRGTRVQHAGQREQEIVLFMEAANRLDTLSQVYVGSLVDQKRVDVQARNQLLANLQEQSTLLRAASTHLRPDEAPTVEAYMTEVGDLAEAVRKVETVQDMAPFWSSMSDTLVAREALVADLRAATGRPVLNARPTDTG
ncbi:hypothetical protein [Brevundimonas sp. FT23028]|uniref:hypothetical protein n=1 Tax=Brevundimonas sp. FT23028 TaxID=3393748 RepID=UPI003B58A6AC